MKNLFNIKNIPFVFTLFCLIGISLAGSYMHYISGNILAYGDAESHLNISKRVMDSITPGLAQLGGIWLPLPHLMMVPFSNFDSLYHSGLAGTIVSGIMFVAAGIAIYKLVYLFSKNTIISFLATMAFALNINLLYLQTTAMTEIPLLAFFIFSIYFFVEYLNDDKKILSLVYAAFFGLCASLSRYDGWFLVLLECFLLVVHGILNKKSKTQIEGMVFLFSSLAFIGIGAWLLWDFLILSDPLYFTNSPFSAKSQQQGWLARGELPSYKNVLSAIQYYGFTSYVNVGKYLTLFSILSIWCLLVYDKIKPRFYLIILLFSPFIFNVMTLYMGQSIIFIPGLTPEDFEWKLFNVRYGVMMIPAAVVFSALFIGQLHNMLPKFMKFASYIILFLVILIQTFSFATYKETAISLDDGLYGLSSARKTDAQDWLKRNYDGGLVLLDDYARSVSIIKSYLPMENVIYIGNKPYWEESLAEPEKHAKWIVMQKGDIVWTTLNENKTMQDRVYKYFAKAYTSPDLLIFKRSEPEEAIVCLPQAPSEF